MCSLSYGDSKPVMAPSYVNYFFVDMKFLLMYLHKVAGKTLAFHTIKKNITNILTLIFLSQFLNVWCGRLLSAFWKTSYTCIDTDLILYMCAMRGHKSYSIWKKSISKIWRLLHGLNLMSDFYSSVKHWCLFRMRSDFDRSINTMWLMEKII